MLGVRSLRRTKMSCLVLAVAACAAAEGPCSLFEIGSGGQICTTEAVPSVVLSIVDTEGEVVAAATIIYRIGSGVTNIGGCNGSCGSVVLAFEAAGRFDIEVWAVGYATATQTVVVELDAAECHPVTEELEIVLGRDETVGALAGAWYTANMYGESVLRFGGDGEIIGAILYDRTIGGDGNFYIAYNGRPIRGVAGQQIFQDTAPEPTRSGDVFAFRATTLGIPMGFENAAISADYNTLTGVLQGVAVTHSRLLEVPGPLLDP